MNKLLSQQVLPAVQPLCLLWSRLCVYTRRVWLQDTNIRTWKHLLNFIAPYNRQSSDFSTSETLSGCILGLFSCTYMDTFVMVALISEIYSVTDRACVIHFRSKRELRLHALMNGEIFRFSFRRARYQQRERARIRREDWRERKPLRKEKLSV